jgi:hypothetical protein
VPVIFAQAVRGLRSVRPRPEITLEEVSPPARLAPYAFAIFATVNREPPATSDESLEVASGRLILLHDPAGHEAWEGTLRLVTYVTAELDAEMATDPLLPEVGWSWLTDALDNHHAPYKAAAGTVTQTLSTRFGDLSERPRPPTSRSGRHGRLLIVVSSRTSKRGARCWRRRRVYRRREWPPCRRGLAWSETGPSRFHAGQLCYRYFPAASQAVAAFSRAASVVEFDRWLFASSASSSRRSR